MEREITVESRGRKVELNAFAQNIVRNTVVALAGSLRDVDPDGEIRIVVKPKLS
jgi:hypothetical protein